MHNFDATQSSKLTAYAAPKNMKNLSSARCTLLVICLVYLPQLTFAQADAAPGVLEAESTRFAAMISADTAALRTMLHPDLLYIHSNGLEESANDLVSSVAAKNVVYQSFDPQQILRVQTFGKTALVDGLVRVSGRYQGDAFLVDLRYTSVYRKVDDKWLLVRWQSLKG